MKHFFRCAFLLRGKNLTKHFAQSAQMETKRPNPQLFKISQTGPFPFRCGSLPPRSASPATSIAAAFVFA